MSELITAETFAIERGFSHSKFTFLKKTFVNFPKPAVDKISLGGGHGWRPALYRRADLERFIEWHEDYKLDTSRRADLRILTQMVKPDFENNLALQFVAGKFATSAEQRRVEGAKRRAAEVQPKTIIVNVQGDYL